MNVLFIDWMTVLNSQDGNTIKLSLLQSVISKTGARVVILDQFGLYQDHLTHLGFVDSDTVLCAMETSRVNAQIKHDPDIEDYFIVSSASMWSTVPKHFFDVEGAGCFTEEAAEAILARWG